MKPETGKTNRSETPNQVSIQLKLGGHSFSVDTLPEKALAQGVCVTFEVLTPRTLLVPTEVFDPELAAACLAAAGISPLDSETVVWSIPAPAANTAPDTARPQTDEQPADFKVEPHVVAVMAVDTKAVETVRTRFGERMRFSSPLLYHPGSTSGVVWLRRADELLYIKVWVDTLRFAEVVTLPTDADILYFIDRLSGEFTLGNYELRIAGDQAREMRKLLSGYFRHTVCE